MEIILQSQDNFNEIAFLDLASGTVSIAQKTERKLKTNGYYNVHEGHVVGFFRLDENLYFVFDKQIIQFQENDNVFIESLPNSRCLFSIQRGQENIFTWEYECRQIMPPISAFQIVNPMISEEDFDIFTFIYNVVNNKDRKERIFRRS